MTFLGIAKASGQIGPDELSIGETNGVPIFLRTQGFGFLIIVEGRRGGDGALPGSTTSVDAPGDPDALPDLQIILSRAIGDNPTAAVCDHTPPDNGGVPAAPSFARTVPITDAINDFGCLFVDGNGNPRGRSSTEACYVPPDAVPRFVNSLSQIEYCATIARTVAFPKGDTLVTVRLRNVNGIVGQEARMIIRSLS